jgi:hypothetical protein
MLLVRSGSGTNEDDSKKVRASSNTFFEVGGYHTDKKENQTFLIYKEIQNGSVAKLYICSFPLILGSPSSYMTLQLLHSEFPYIRGKFDFLFYQCSL